MTKPTSNSIATILLSGVLGASLPLAAGCGQAAASEARSTGSKGQQDMHDKDIQELEKAEQVWVTSLTTANAKLLATLIDDPFTFIGPDAQVEERQAYLAGYEGLTAAGVEVQSIDLSEVQFRVLTDVGIVTGRVEAHVTMQGTPIVENVRFTRVYRRTPDGWRMVAGQGTRIPDVQSQAH